VPSGVVPSNRLRRVNHGDNTCRLSLVTWRGHLDRVRAARIHHARICEHGESTSPDQIHVRLTKVRASSVSPDVATVNARHLSRLTPRLSVAILVVAYLSFALTFSLLTRAYEANDEAAHTEYIEYIVQHHSIPHIGVANGGESHQPPLYYLLAAGWQRLLGIPAFTPHVALTKQPLVPNRLILSHSYTASQHEDAVHLHELRLLSVMFGLGTVVLTYAGAKVIGLREPMALSSGLFVALLPRELVLSTDVTNDALIIPLCALALLLFLLSERARTEGRHRHRRLHLLGMGLALGAGAATKFSGLPVAGILLILAFVPSIRLSQLPRTTSALQAESADNFCDSRRHFGIERRLAFDGTIAVIGFLAPSIWWFIRNKELYGQFLATKKSESYLAAFLGDAHPIPWSAHLLFVQVPHVFLETTWYGQPNLSLPMWTNDVLAALGLICLAGGAWVILVDQSRDRLALHSLSGLALLGCIVGGLAAVIINIKTTSIGDARVAFVGITAFATVLTLGCSRLVGRITPRLQPMGLWVWPTALFGLDIYVICHFLIPLGGL
jgi:hypothetical protein